MMHAFLQHQQPKTPAPPHVASLTPSASSRLRLAIKAARCTSQDSHRRVPVRSILCHPRSNSCRVKRTFLRPNRLPFPMRERRISVSTTRPRPPQDRATLGCVPRAARTSETAQQPSRDLAQDWRRWRRERGEAQPHRQRRPAKKKMHGREVRARVPGGVSSS
jgi:hypothetical protein